MRAYLTAFRLRVQRGMDQKAASLAGIVTQFFWGWMLISVLFAFTSGHADTPMGGPAMVTYIWLQQSFFAFTALWLRDSEIISSILSGNLAVELCRPVDLYFSWVTRILARRVSSVALRFPPILITASLLPSPFRLAPPASAQSFLLFVVALLLAGILLSAISVFIYVLTLVTRNPAGSFLLIGPLGELLSGKLVPLPFFPDSLRAVFERLPFAYTADFPFRIWTGHIGISAALEGIGVELLWVAILVVLGRAALGGALRRIVFAGG